MSAARGLKSLELGVRAVTERGYEWQGKRGQLSLRRMAIRG